MNTGGINRGYQKKHRWHLLLTLFLVMSIFLPCLRLQAFAASQVIKNGWYMIQSGNSSNRVLDINNWNMNNGGNLETYQKNQTTNQIFYLSYVTTSWGTQYYTIRCLHSGKYIHTYDGKLKNTNVHQWEGTNNNAQWGLQSAGNGYYYFRNRASGAYLDNSNGSTANGNNVITYPQNKSAAQKWKPIAVSKPTFVGNVSNYKSISGDYTNSDTKKVTGNVTINYPVTKIQIGIFNTSGKYMRGTYMYPNSRSFSFSYTFSMSGLAKGKYYYRIRMWDVWGDLTRTSPSYFNIVDKTLFNSSSEIYLAASKYKIDTNSNQFNALKSIDKKYYDRLKGNKKGINIFLFEGVGAISSSNNRMNAMCVVVKNGAIVYINKYCSTIPDNPFSPWLNDGDPVPTLVSGVYSFTSTNHKSSTPVSSRYIPYAALHVVEENNNVVRHKNSREYWYGKSKYINVHGRSGQRTTSSKNSCGCQLVGDVFGSYPNEYANFLKAVGVVGQNVTVKKGTTCQNWPTGLIVIDRAYARSYLKNVGYTVEAINMIGTN